jgi:hypothetical protein
MSRIHALKNYLQDGQEEKMDEFVTVHNKIKIDATVEALKKHDFSARSFETKEDVAKFIMVAAADCRTVGIAGTHTVRALGIVPMLEQAGKTLYDHWQFKVGAPEELDCRKKQMTADLFLSSANAITMTGEIVNRDGCGNRINAMTFGPGKVIIVVGRNKITTDLDAAFDRIEFTAAPLRALSLDRKTPCVSTGVCMDCESAQRICRITSVIHRQPMMTNITVAIVDEELGY